jgi:hypothetical protein
MNVTSSVVDPRNFSPRIAVAVLAVGCVAFFWHPLALLLFACLVAILSPTDEFKWLFLVAACALFLILNVSRLVDGDLYIYVRVQDYISQRPFDVLFEKEGLQLLSGTYRETEMGFYAPLWLVSLVIPDSKTAIALAATLGIYVPTFLGLMLIGRSENWGKGAILMAALFAFFAGINFVQSTHLIRQYISSAMLFYAFALFIAKRNRWAVLVALAACTVHNGSAPLIFLTGSVCWLFHYREGKRLGLAAVFIRVVGVLALMVVVMVAVPIVQGSLLKDEIPNIHIGHFLVVGAFLIIAHVAIQRQHLRLRSLYYARLVFLVIYIVSLGFYAIGIALFALRYFAYLEWLYGLLVGGVMFTVFRGRPELRVFARFTVSLLAVAVLIARVATAEWVYGPGDNNLVSWDFFQVAQLVSR